MPLQGLPLLSGLAFADSYTQDGKPCPPECVSDSMEIVTWYPSPYNEYEELRLYPKHSYEESQCNSFEQLGLMYYNQDEQALKVCRYSDAGYNWEKITLGEGKNFHFRIFDSDGIFVVPIEVNKITVEVWGAGGGGGGYGEGTFNVTPGDSYSVYIGIGGKGGVASYNCDSSSVGYDGGETKFGNLITATGGRGGQGVPIGKSVANGGQGGSSNGSKSEIGAEGSNNSGGVGKGGNAGGGGGGCGGAGVRGSATIVIDGMSPGGGGGGEGGNNQPANQTFGGRGANGRIIVKWDE